MVYIGTVFTEFAILRYAPGHHVLHAPSGREFTKFQLTLYEGVGSPIINRVVDIASLVALDQSEPVDSIYAWLIFPEDRS